MAGGSLQGGGCTIQDKPTVEGLIPSAGQGKLRHTQPRGLGRNWSGTTWLPPPRASARFLQGEKDLSGLLHHSEYVCFGSELICISLLI